MSELVAVGGLTFRLYQQRLYEYIVYLTEAELGGALEVALIP